jgi:hypothetical protein
MGHLKSYRAPLGRRLDRVNKNLALRRWLRRADQSTPAMGWRPPAAFTRIRTTPSDEMKTELTSTVEYGFCSSSTLWKRAG